MGVQQADVFQDPVAPVDTDFSDLSEDVRTVALKFGLPAGLLVLVLVAALLVVRFGLLR